MDDYAGQSVWIIGASSGIGRALALELASRGANLFLSSRDGKKLADLNGSMASLHTVIPCDITASESVSGAVRDLKEKCQRLDKVIFIAGHYEPMPLDNLDMAQTTQIIETNLTGALRILHEILPVLLTQKHGQIALCASVAGYRGLPNAQPYGATKAALINIAESLRAEVGKRGIDVRVINPGFVKTPMTDKNSFKMPMMVGAETAAKAIADGLLGHSFEIHFPKRFTTIMKILRILPSILYFKLASR